MYWVPFQFCLHRTFVVWLSPRTITSKHIQVLITQESLFKKSCSQHLFNHETLYYLRSRVLLYETSLCISLLCYLHCKPESHCDLHYKQWKYTVYIFLCCCEYWLVLLNISKLINCIQVFRHCKQKNSLKISNKSTLFGIKINSFIFYLLKAIL